MNDPTHNTFGTDDMAAEKGVSSIVFTIVISAIVLFIAVATAFIIIMDKINGLDAYRQTETRRQRDGYKQICDENYAVSLMRTEWERQNNVSPPPEFTVQKPCVVPEAVENTNH